MGEISTAEAIRDKVLAESANRCCMCAAHIGFRVEVTPIIPLTEGGAYNPSNLAVLCPFCRWLAQRQKISAAALRAFKKQWQADVHKAAKAFHEHGLTIEGQPLRLEADHHSLRTVLEGSELSQLLSNFFNCLDTFLIHEDQHLENAASLAVIRAFRDMYNYVPPEKDIKDLSTADSRKLDLLYRGIRSLFSVGLMSRPKAGEKPEGKPAAKKPPAAAAASKKPAAKAPVAKKPPAGKPTSKKPASKGPAASKLAPHKPAKVKPAAQRKKVAARKPARKRR